MTLENSLTVGLRVGYLCEHTREGTSHRHWLKARLTNGLTYLLTIKYNKRKIDFQSKAVKQDKRLFQFGSQEGGLVKYDKYTCKNW